MTTNTTLSTLAVDFNSSKTQLQTLLAATGAPWQALLAAETGDAVVSLISTVHASAQQNIIRSFQDVFPSSAVADSAVYAAATMQGVRLNRKLPASLTVTVKNTGKTSVNIPPYSIFSGANTYWFNRTLLTVTAGGTITATFYQGLVKSVAAQGLGSNNQLWASQETQFYVSDVDTMVTINGSPVPRLTSSLFDNKGVGYFDRTLANGAFVTEFGDGVYGSKPLVSDSVVITYVVTNGSSANSINALNKLITAQDFQTITVTAVSNPTGGADQSPSIRYKNIAASSFGTFDSAVNKSQYIRTILEYPGVLDAATFAEREVQGSDPRWMNLVQVSVLTSTVWGSVEITNFINTLQASTGYTTRFNFVSPVPLVTNVNANIYCRPWASLSVAQSLSTSVVRQLFADAKLNYDIAVTDITTAIINSYKGIDYVDLVSPTSDLVVSTPQIIPPVLTVDALGGSLPAGSPVYAVGYKTLTSTVYPTNRVYALTSGTTSKVTINFLGVQSAQSYQIYGRGAAGYGVISEFSATPGQVNYSFIDLGSSAIVPPSSAPGLHTRIVSYNTLGALTINPFYSSRAAVAGGR